MTMMNNRKRPKELSDKCHVILDRVLSTTCFILIYELAIFFFRRHALISNQIIHPSVPISCYTYYSMASSSVSATFLGFAPSLTLSSKSAHQVSSRFGAVSVGWSRRSFPSLRSSRFRIYAAQPETVDKVCEIVRKQLALPPESQLTPETTFTALGADSLDTVEIVMGLEEEFGISVEEQSSENITCIKEAADLIEKLLQNKPPSS
ncbi:hypothetical protein PIB30_070116 [Stylosanthes scabra]|uniref:Acyl carrier protein n=1 Tax=Stylosanthes scabra TaxID=79078 RepID=A0ABU6ZM05_9FABA|nr:hypothetical protein [Stylosanthes scabra]